MKDYFSWRDFPLTFVFESWVINSVLALVFTCISVATIGILFEGIRVMRVWVKRLFYVSPLFPVLPRGLTNSQESEPAVMIPNNQAYIRKCRIRNHIIQTAIHIVRVAGGYFLMLAFMTYNAYVAISIVLGAGLGYFLFCHELTKWREPDSCSGATSPATAMSSTSCTPPGEESHPMLHTCPRSSRSVNDEDGGTEI